MRVFKSLVISLFLIAIFALPTFAADYKNSLGMEFVKIKAGTFLMGNDPKQFMAPEDDEEPLHKVTLTKDFYLGAFEVSQAQWTTVMGDNPSLNKGTDLPVENITIDQILEFIKKLNEREGTDMYRLPTEAEWEYAARAGSTTPWHFGKNASDIGEYDWVSINTDSTKKIGTRKPNAWGIYDVHGNVKEVVSDYYEIEYYQWSPEVDPKGPKDDIFGSRVVRGGAWYNSPERTRSSYRFFLDNGEVDENIGFRLAFTDRGNLPDKAPSSVAPPDIAKKPTTQNNDSSDKIIKKKDSGGSSPSSKKFDPKAADPTKSEEKATDPDNPSVEKFSKIKSAFDAKSRFSIKKDEEE
ncbi:MAG: formylglycine-generating enzyme family protein [Deltaproteobacteria bacterium]|jgi:formylglycine-generating enzyme required for sulfatase activity|nr:formylglycine-generating enzyme family protein [Deltaproteobacteria bacterium]